MSEVSDAAASYDGRMDTLSATADFQLARLAGAIAEPARARMLGCLMDGHARTATELATVAEVAASTASAHLARLKEERLVELLVQGKHRYFRLASDDVAAALESLMVVAGTPRATEFKPNTPSRLRSARTCYDHMAGTAGVALHDRLHAQGWLSGLHSGSYELTPEARSRWRAWVWRSTRCAARAGASPAPASTGASAGRTWAARWAPRGSSCRCGGAGCARSWTAARSRSRRRRSAKCRSCSPDQAFSLSR